MKGKVVVLAKWNEPAGKGGTCNVVCDGDGFMFLVFWVKLR